MGKITDILGLTGYKKKHLMSKEVHSGEFVPYEFHYNENTIITKNNYLLQVIKVSGFPFETADDEDVDMQKGILNQLFKSIASANFGLYFHTIRTIQNRHAGGFFEKRIGNFFADQVNQAWKKKNASGTSFQNEIYLTVIRITKNKGVAAFTDILKGFSSIINREKAKLAEIKSEAEELEEIVGRIVSALRAYSPKILGIRYTKNGAFSEVLGFFRRIINCLQENEDPIPPSIKISEYLPSCRLYFGPRSIEIIKHDGVRYAGMVSLKEYGQFTYSGILDGFLHLPYELIITQSFSFTNRQVAISKMQIQQNRMIQSQDKAISQIAEISRALDDAMSGRVAFGNHHLSILCVAKSPKGLENALSAIGTELANTGVYPVREKMNLEPAFWGQLPSNFDYIVRKATINTLNLAGFASHHNYPTGSQYGNHWGDAVTVFDTTSNTSFFFSFHVRDVGHTMIIGPTGAGKTVLMNFLCAQAMKFRPRMFFFDKDKGAEIFIRGLGGRYTIIEPRTPCNFNPLQLNDTPDNRTFLSDWLKELVSVNGEKVSAENIAHINDAISGNYKLEKKDRKLSNLVAFLGLEIGESLASRIKMWHSDGSHAALFDNTEDKLDLESVPVYGFEMGNLLKDKAALGPVLLYLFHRINISLDGSPTMIVLDEAWALIDNPVFGPRIKDWLKVLRKLNTFVIFATQSVEDASKSAISDTLVQQTATQIFLPNQKATEVYRTVFMLTKREYILIKNTDPATRFFLIKQTMSAVVARINLKGMDDIINILSGRAESVILLDKIIKSIGTDNPEKWIPIFYKKVKTL